MDDGDDEALGCGKPSLVLFNEKKTFNGFMLMLLFVFLPESVRSEVKPMKGTKTACGT